MYAVYVSDNAGWDEGCPSYEGCFFGHDHGGEYRIDHPEGVPFSVDFGSVGYVAFPSYRAAVALRNTLSKSGDWVTEPGNLERPSYAVRQIPSPRLTKSGTPDRRSATATAQAAAMTPEQRTKRARKAVSARWGGDHQWTISQIGGDDWADGIKPSRSAAKKAAANAIGSRCAQGFAPRGSRYTVTVYPAGSYGEGGQSYIARDVVA